MLARLRARERGLGGAREGRALRALPHEQALGLDGAPRLRANAAECEPRLAHDAVLDAQRRAHGDERERVRRAVAHLEVARLREFWPRGQAHARDELALREHALSLGVLARQEVKIGERDLARPRGPARVDDGVERQQRDAHVRGVRGDALVARAEHGVHPVVTVEGAAARAGRALVAGRGRIAKVVAARALQQVATHGRHVAQLRARAREQRLGQQGVARDDVGVPGQIAVPHHGADVQPVVRDLDLPERQRVDVDELRRLEHVELHEIEQRGAPRDEGGIGRRARRDDGRVDGRDLEIANGPHAPQPLRTLSMAATMFGYAPQRQRLPLICSRMSSADRACPSASRPTADMI